MTSLVSRRELLWVAVAVAAYPLLGIASLVIAAFASSATGVATVEREFVLAAQMGLWGVLAALVTVIGGRLLGVVRHGPSSLEWANVAMGMLVGIALALAGAAVARQGGVLDADTLGISPIVSALVIAVASARLGMAVASAGAQAVWSFIAFTLCVASIVTTVLGLTSPIPLGAWLSVLLIAAGLYSLFQITNLARGLMVSRRAANPISG